VDAVSAAIDLHGVAMIAIGSGPAATPGAPSRSLANTLAQAVVRLLRQTCVRRLLLEGGATATAVLQARDWTRLHAGCPLAPGIATLQPEGAGEIELLIKPGSYDWPEVVWPVVSAARKDDGRK
jgi:D-threonate/D-erythronate kinase